MIEGRPLGAALCALALAACAAPAEAPSAPDSAVDTSPPTPAPACEVAADCGAEQLCESGDCVAAPVAATPNEPPQVVVNAPSDGDVFLSEVSVPLVVTVSDDGKLSDLVVRWRTNRGGHVGDATIDADGLATYEAKGLVSGAHILTVTVTDAEGLATQAGVAITIDGRPSRPVIALEPSDPDTADDLVVTFVHEAQDYNRASNALTYRYRWFVDQVERDDLSGDTVPHTATLRGQSWSVRVAASDPTGFGDEAVATVSIGNAAPTCEVVTLLPDSGDTTTTFTCLCAAREDLDPDDMILDTCTFYDGDEVLSEVTGQAAAWRHPRGCALSWTVRYIHLFAPTRAAALWARYKDVFLVRKGIFAGFREWPPG
ncbi:MAG: VCBS domain-containing protein, partial [Myxococcota bacterium]|nr:VCBS domain-containing protein [Myxococcota bacterium]